MTCGADRLVIVWEARTSRLTRPPHVHCTCVTCNLQRNWMVGNTVVRHLVQRRTMDLRTWLRYLRYLGSIWILDVLDSRELARVELPGVVRCVEWAGAGVIQKLRKLSLPAVYREWNRPLEEDWKRACSLMLELRTDPCFVKFTIWIFHFRNGGSPKWMVFLLWMFVKSINGWFTGTHMGVSENSVPLNPMVLLIIIPIKWLFHWEYTLFSDKPT